MSCFIEVSSVWPDWPSSTKARQFKAEQNLCFVRPVPQAIAANVFATA